MQVSFTGIKNVGGRVHRGGEVYSIVLELTDEGTKDLSEFKDVFEKHPLLNEAFENHNILNLHSTYFGKEEPASDGSSCLYNINGHWLRPENDKERVTILSKLAALIRKVAESEEEFPLSKTYLKSTECLNHHRPWPSPEDAIEPWEEEMLEKAHKLSEVKKAAKGILTDINKNMCDIFDVNYSEIVKLPKNKV